MTDAGGKTGRTPLRASTFDYEAETLVRFRYVTLVSMLTGVGAFTVSLWPVASLAVLVPWMKAGLLLGMTCWLLARGAISPVAVRMLTQRRLLMVLSLVMGCFWGLSAWLLFPAGSPSHQALLALIIAVVIVAWLPVFILAPVLAAGFGAVAAVPWSLLLLSVHEPLPATAGLVLLLLVVILVLTAGAARRLLRAESDAWQELRYRATHDSLVDLPNQAEFHRHLSSLNGHIEFAVLVIDLDDFKGVNDRAGHAAGDQVLRLVADVLRGFVRDADKAGRLGGDEFAIVLANSDVQDAARVAAAIQTGIRRLRPAGPAWHCRISASIGIGYCSAVGLARAAAVLQAADDACYRAKQRGRDRIEIAPAIDGSCARPRRMRPVPGDADRLRQIHPQLRHCSPAAGDLMSSANDASFASKGSS